MSLTEDDVEEVAIEYLTDLGYSYLKGNEISPNGEHPERSAYSEVVLEGRLRRALARINKHLSAEELDDVVRRIRHLDDLSLEENNLNFRSFLTRGIELESRKDGRERGEHAWLFDFKMPENNDWFVVNQLIVKNGRNECRLDLVVFVNGLPLAVFELKNPGNENATLDKAWNQLQTYKKEIPSLFNTNELLIVSDGIEAKVGSLTAGYERFGSWRTIDGNGLASDKTPKLEVLIKGLFEKSRFLNYIRFFGFWETEKKFTKKIATYYQFHAVNKAVAETIRASTPNGDKRIGVIWHTQGSGKSVSMVFYVSKLTQEMNNPTVVVITDRNDLDGQLYGQFCKAKGMFETPKQAKNKEGLKKLLKVASGGIIFSTIQKFGTLKGERFPELSNRRNIIVITDEAHRSQYEFVDGFARNLRDGLPNASFIGFTGTPIEFEDKSTPAVFGDYIDTYPIAQAVEDKATVPIYYEARLAKISLPEEKKPEVDEEFEEVTEGEEDSAKHKLKSKWARLEAMVGTDERLELIAKDIISHFERRLEILDGKAMIVTMSRRIAVDLYEQIVKLKPKWDSEDDEKGSVKVVMTGSASDPPAFQKHIRKKPELKKLGDRFKEPSDPLKMVIVRDMWLTGFDAPCAHTLYVDKPMKGHGLMQAIARVNRVFGEKPSGLVVDYLGLAEQLRQAVVTYGGNTGAKETQRPSIPIEVALTMLQEKFGIVRDMFHPFDYTGYFSAKKGERLAALSGGADHICADGNGKKRFFDAMIALNKAAGIAIHLEGARSLRDELGYFQAVQSQLRKYTVGGGGKSKEELNAAIRQIVSGAVASEGVVDIFEAAGLKKPDISILSDEFLESVKENPHKNLQLELLKKLINDQIRVLSRQNIVQSRKFSEMLERTLLSYQNRTLEAAQVIVELIELAREMRESPKRGQQLGLTEDEMAFYDALVEHGNVRELMGDEKLAAIAQDLVTAIRSSVSLDWTQKKSVRADMRRKVKKLLRKHGYPPDKRKDAVTTVIEQAETVCRDWAEQIFEGEESKSEEATEAKPRQKSVKSDERTQEAEILPFQRVNAANVEPFVNAVPMYENLEVAAGQFSDTQNIEKASQGLTYTCDAQDWVSYDGRPQPSKNLFVARVVGESMNRRIPNGAWCLWRLNPGGSREGQVVLCQHRGLSDPEHGGSYTVKVYSSEKEELEDGKWRHKQITLTPDSDEPSFKPIVLENLEEGDFTIIASLVKILS